HAYEGSVLRSIPSREGPRIRAADPLRLHTQARQLAQRGGMRTELHDRPIPFRPPHRRHRDPAIGNRRLGRANEHQATGRRLAVYYREGPHQTEAALPEDLDWTRH